MVREGGKCMWEGVLRRMKVWLGEVLNKVEWLKRSWLSLAVNF